MKAINKYIIEKFKISSYSKKLKANFDFDELNKVIDDYFKFWKYVEYSVTYEDTDILKDNKDRVLIKIYFNNPIEKNRLESWLKQLCKNIDAKTKYTWTHRDSYALGSTPHIEICIQEADEIDK